ncbi:MAG: hypothetical protein KAS22_09675 [Candidatus Heimdallarchaeota archaeon]|nr:hypothetical protein [Candidatus Heimdallarchaeota archaeon]MCK5182831.1 hypothetical protein [Candidatus Heimdallarchaeota archaeon]
MKKKIILFLIVTCFLGATLIPAVQADDPNYITYGQVMSMFRASLGSTEIFYHNGAFHAAPALGDYGGRIVPWWNGAWYRYQDAHIIQIGFYFEIETHDEAVFLVDNLDIIISHQGPNDNALEELPVITTALSRRMYPGWVVPNEGTGWRIDYGVPYHQKELAVGVHTLVTEMYLFGELAWYLPITFSIVVA